MRYQTERTEGNGWSRWVPPKMRGYKMACCDCSLVHELEFRVVRVLKNFRDGSRLVRPVSARKYRVEFRARRAERATAAMRGKKRRVKGGARGGRARPRTCPRS